MLLLSRARGYLLAALTILLTVTPLTVIAAPADAAGGRDNRVRVLSANLYVKNPRPAHAARVIRHNGPHVAGLQEAHGHPDFRVRRYRKIAGPSKWAAANPVLIRRRAGIRVEGTEFHQLTPQIGPRSRDAARWATVVDFRLHGASWTILNTHLPVVSRSRTPDPARSVTARAYADGFDRLMTLAQGKAAEGRRIIITGDLNDRPRPGIAPWAWLPADALPRHGYRVRRHGVDYIAVRGARFRARWTIDRRRTGSDHLWLSTVIR